MLMKKTVNRWKVVQKLISHRKTLSSFIANLINDIHLLIMFIRSYEEILCKSFCYPTPSDYSVHQTIFRSEPMCVCVCVISSPLWDKMCCDIEISIGWQRVERNDESVIDKKKKQRLQRWKQPPTWKTTANDKKKREIIF